MKKLLIGLSIMIALITGISNNVYANVSGNWVQDNLGWTFIQENGNSISSGWVQIHGGWYYFESNGYMKTGWLQDGGAWYYLTEAGNMVSGWNQIDGNWYYFSPSGAMLVNTTTPDGCFVNQDGIWVSEPLQKSTVSYMSVQEETMLTIINAERAQVGLAPLSTDSTGHAVAEIRAEEITRLFSHTRPDGTDYKVAMKEVGLKSSFSGENVAFATYDVYGIMDGFMASQGHANNILHSRFTHVGVAHTTDANGYSYWAQIFYTIK